MRRLILALLLLRSASPATSAHSVSLAWQPGIYAKSVNLRIWRQKNKNAFAQIKQLGNATTSWTDTNVVAGSSYSYYVIACDMNTTDCSAASNIVSATVR